MSREPKPGSGWNEALRQPALGHIVPTPPAAPAAETARSMATRPVTPPPPPPLPQETPLVRRSPAKAKRSVLPILLLLVLCAGSLAVAGYFAVENSASQEKLAEANRTAATAREEYERTAGSMIAKRETEWEEAKVGWATKEKELLERAKQAEQDVIASQRESRNDLEKARDARSLAEARLTSEQSKLGSANREVARLRTQLADSQRKSKDVFQTTSPDIRSWMKGLLEPLPDLDTREEVRIALRKHEMTRLFDAEKTRLDKTIVVGSGPLVLAARGKEGLAHRGVILRYANLSSPLPANIVDATYAYHWNISESATTLDPGSDKEVTSFNAPAFSEDATKEIQFDYRKTDDSFRHIETETPIEYKNAKTRMVLAIKFKDRRDSKTPRLLIYKVTSLERGK